MKYSENLIKCHFCKRMKDADKSYRVKVTKTRHGNVCDSCHRFYTRGLTFNKKTKKWGGYSKEYMLVYQKVYYKNNKERILKRFQRYYNDKKLSTIRVLH